ncbi:MAG: hypothetical protein NT027_08110 [Proteobacteria bacterium]|nr:hypothetical protein [Pseudomonadota bacterium]
MNTKRYNLNNLSKKAGALSMLVALTGCGNIFLSMTSGGKSPAASFKLDEDSVFNDVQTRCGGTTAELSSTKTPFLVADFTSLPIVVTGKRRDIEYKVEAIAKLHVESGGPNPGSKIDTELKSITATSGGVDMVKGAIDELIRPDAEKSIAEKRGTSTSTSVPSLTIIKLGKEEGPYKGMFCAVGFNLGQADNKGGQKGALSFDKPLPLALNPKAGIDTYSMELGEGKSFTATVTVDVAKKEGLPAGTEVPVTVTWKKISSDIKKLSGIPTTMNLPKISSDIAYEVITKTSGKHSLAKLGMSSRRVFYVNTTEKNFAAIVEFSEKEEDATEEVPPTVLVRD